jgi:hypothetical protein
MSQSNSHSLVLERLTLSLSAEILDDYRAQADSQGISVEELLGDRLSQCVSYNSNRPLYFNDDQRARLESVMGGGVCPDSEKAVSRIENTRSLNISAANRVTKVILPPSLVSRFKSRCFGRKWHQAITEEVIKGLEQYCAMR